MVRDSKTPANPISAERRNLLDQIGHLGASWHGAGSVANRVLDAIAELCPPAGFQRTLETGCGRTTLLLSHLSRDHTVFTFTEDHTLYKSDDSHARTSGSRILNPASTRFVLGPTQKTFPSFAFADDYDFILLDGPHSYPFVELEYFYVYPRLRKAGILAIDDIHIPTIHNLFSFLREDEMFQLVRVVCNTAFFERTESPLFDPYGDDWAAQKYNAKRYPIQIGPGPSWLRKVVGRILPPPVKSFLRPLFGNASRTA